MTTTEILTMLQRDIHTTVFATVDEQGFPQTCVIDEKHCLHCGNCLSVCPVGAVERHTEEREGNR